MPLIVAGRPARDGVDDRPRDDHRRSSATGFGGLGFFIFEGYRHSFPTEILIGAIPSILLAVGVDLLLVRLERRLTPWSAPSVAAARPTAA